MAFVVSRLGRVLMRAERVKTMASPAPEWVPEWEGEASAILGAAGSMPQRQEAV